MRGTEHPARVGERLVIGGRPLAEVMPTGEWPCPLRLGERPGFRGPSPYNLPLLDAGRDDASSCRVCRL